MQNLARPDGNITGFTNFEPSLAGKWLGLLKEIDPRVARVAGLFNPDTAPDGGSYFSRAFEAAARNVAIAPFVNPVRSNAEIGSAISAVASEPGPGLVIMADSFMAVHRGTVIEQAVRHRVPAVCIHFVRLLPMVAYCPMGLTFLSCFVMLRPTWIAFSGVPNQAHYLFKHRLSLNW